MSSALGKLRPHTVLLVTDVRDALGAGWSTRRTRRWLKRTGAATKVRGTNRYVTTPARIAAHFSESLDALYARTG